MSALLSLLLASAPPVEPGRASRAEGAAETPVPAGKVSTANPRSIVAALQKEGYRAKLVTDGKRPYVESAASGANFTIYLESCENDTKCADVMFQSSYEKRETDPIKVDTINAFNRETRWGRAYLDNENDPVIEMDVLFTEQLIDEKMFAEALTVWANTLGKFHKAIDF